MRGKGPAAAGQRYIGRITPAYAGKSTRDKLTALKDADHPRLCGEKFRSISPTK